MLTFFRLLLLSPFFFVNDTATTEIYTLSYTTLFRSPSRSPGPWRRRPPQSRCNVPDYFPAFLDLRERRCLVDRKSTRLNSSHTVISYAVFCLKKKKQVE